MIRLLKIALAEANLSFVMVVRWSGEPPSPDLSVWAYSNETGEGTTVSKIVTRTDFSKVVRQKVCLSRVDAAKLFERVLNGICATLASGKSVKLSGFGTFMMRSRQYHAI